MTWRVAESLEVLRKQLNFAFPNRSKLSDGSIGDAAHASRSSDHNPYLKDSKGVGIVSARDFTHDPKGGLDCNWLARQLVKSRDPRIKYIIWNKQICSSKQQAWVWRPYSGINAHQHHLHLSVIGDEKYFDNRNLWDLDIAVTKSELTPQNIAKKIDAVTVPSPKPQVVSPKSIVPSSGESETGEPPVVKEVPQAPEPNPDKEPNTEKQDICKERPSTFVRIGTIITGAVGTITTFGVNLSAVLQNKLEQITPAQIFYVVIGVALVALAIWFYDRSASRANVLNQQKLGIAANPDLITTELNANKNV